MTVSVCMASYNGERYLARQLGTVLEQLGSGDEVVVVDDCSADGTVAVLNSFGDPRVRVVVNDRNRGEVYSFSRALQLARNDVVFLADQDDVWVPGRAALMATRLMASGAMVVSGNLEWMDAAERPVVVPFDGVAARHSRRHAGNIADIFLGKRNYFGCAMALRREFVRIVTPVPAWTESHDLWIALASNVARANLHIDDVVLRKRLHANNATTPVSTRSLYQKLRARLIFVASLVVLVGRLARARHA